MKFSIATGITTFCMQMRLSQPCEPEEVQFTTKMQQEYHNVPLSKSNSYERVQVVGHLSNERNKIQQMYGRRETGMRETQRQQCCIEETDGMFYKNMKNQGRLLIQDIRVRRYVRMLQ